MEQKPDSAVTHRRLRIFTLRLGLFLMIFGAILLRKRFSVYPYWAGACLCYLLPSLAFPALIRPVRWALLKLARGVEIASTFVALWILYFLVVTPLALLARLFGKEFLALKRKRDAKSYWISRKPTPSDPAEWERQY